MEKKCKKCRKTFSYTEADIRKTTREYESYGETIHCTYAYIKCPNCGEFIYLDVSGWSV